MVHAVSSGADPGIRCHSGRSLFVNGHQILPHVFELREERGTMALLRREVVDEDVVFALDLIAWLHHERVRLR